MDTGRGTKQNKQIHRERYQAKQTDPGRDISSCTNSYRDIRQNDQTQGEMLSRANRYRERY